MNRDNQQVGELVVKLQSGSPRSSWKDMPAELLEQVIDGHGRLHSLSGQFEDEIRGMQS